jgi:hypothetical protein
LLRLPAELREQIWRHAVSGSSGTRIQCNPGNLRYCTAKGMRSRPHPLLHVSATTLREAAAMWYSTQNFALYLPMHHKGQSLPVHQHAAAILKYAKRVDLDVFRYYKPSAIHRLLLELDFSGSSVRITQFFLSECSRCGDGPDGSRTNREERAKKAISDVLEKDGGLRPEKLEELLAVVECRGEGGDSGPTGWMWR